MTLAGDADRERAIVLLRDATVEGRLTLDEFAERVERTELARTDAELETITADCRRRAAPTCRARHRAVFARLERSGRWELAPVSRCCRSAATIVLDLGQATLHGPRRRCTCATSSGP